MNITRTLGEDGVCLLTFDRPGSSANLFDRATLDELDEHIASLEQAAGLKGVILCSAKPSVFIAGADLNTLSRSASADAIGTVVDIGHRVFARLSRLPAPSVAAIHGAALGGGCEVALACDWRVASDGKPTKIGLPETQLGILPAWGGSVRLPRLIGLPAALGLILTGRQLSGVKAFKAGLVDEVAHPEYLLDAARRLLGRGRRPAPRRRLTSLAPIAELIASRARKDVMKKTRGHYPAPFKAIDVCTASLSRSLEAGFALEKAAFLELAQTTECHSLINIFFLQERAKKLALSDAPAGPAAIRRAGVVGAGVMGAGIAQWIAGRGIPVTMLDVSPAALARGLHAAEGVFKEAARRGAFTPVEARAGLDRITPTVSHGPLVRADIVIEAAVEKLDLKQKIFRRLEESAPAAAVLATNTSALSIDALADGLARPERVLGLHFFNPVHRMQLVEIVRGSRTSPAALATALQFAKAIGKLPVIVRDSPGFLVNRVLMPYLVEAVRMFAAGAEAREIDRFMLDFGMPMGPLRLCDEVGLDVARHVAADLSNRLPVSVPLDPVVDRMIEKGWLGKKSGRGFYLHEGKDGGRKANPAATALRDHVAAPADHPNGADRLVLIMVNEAARCLEERVVEDPADVDFAMIFGTGWAPFRGGPLRHADALGLATVVARLEQLARVEAPHFTPCERLREMARAGVRFYAKP